MYESDTRNTLIEFSKEILPLPKHDLTHMLSYISTKLGPHAVNNREKRQILEETANAIVVIFGRAASTILAPFVWFTLKINVGGLIELSGRGGLSFPFSYHLRCLILDFDLS